MACRYGLDYNNNITDSNNIVLNMTDRKKNNKEETLTLTPKRVDTVNELPTITTNSDEPNHNVHKQVSTLTSLKQQKEEKYTHWSFKPLSFKAKEKNEVADKSDHFSYKPISFISRTADEDPLIPVTARMVIQSKPPKLSDGRNPAFIKMVAAVREVIKSNLPCTTSVTYNVEDGTGLVQVKQFVNFEYENSAETEMRREVSKENVYVKIIGKIVQYTDGQRLIVADNIRKVSTGNELTHHLLEVVHSGEKHKCKMRNTLHNVNHSSNSCLKGKKTNTSNDSLTKTILNMIQGK